MNRKTAIKQLGEIKKFIKGKELRLAAEWEEDWQILISTILSSQTKDEKTIEISNHLYKRYNSLERLSKAKLSDVKRIIRPINYYKTKSKHILETARILVRRFGGKIPSNREELMEFPGVGRKVANVYLVEAENADAIGVDTHVSRLAKKLGWTKEKNPHKIEKDLEKLFPKKYWNSINYILVKFGRIYRLKGEDDILKRIIEKHL
jgi:endonuclease III